MTDNAKVTILNLLKEGKITPDEAERILRAMGSSKSGAESSSPQFDEFFRQMGREIRSMDLSTFSTRAQSAFDDFRKTFSEMAWDTRPANGNESTVIEGNGSFDVADLKTVHIKQKGGEVQLVPATNNRVRIDSPICHVGFAEGDTRVTLDGVGGILKVAVPKHVRQVYVDATGGSVIVKDVSLDGLTVRLVGGSARVEGTKSPLKVNVGGGSVHLADIETDSVEAETNGGGIFARLGDVTSGEYTFIAAGGGVTVELGENSEFDATYTVTVGMFDTQWDEAEIIGKNGLRVGDGGATLELTAHSGSIALWKGE